MNLQGILTGVFSFLIIGLFHPIVIKCEYHFTYKIWPIFLILGILFMVLSFITVFVVPSAVFGVMGFTCWWSIRELFEQRDRVKKGWFPKRGIDNK